MKKKEEITEEVKTKKGHKGLILGIIFAVLLIAAGVVIVAYFRSTGKDIPIIDNITIKQDWAKKYYNYLKKGEHKKDIKEAFGDDFTLEKAEFIGHDDDSKPAMVLYLVNKDGKMQSILYTIVGDKVLHSVLNYDYYILYNVYSDKVDHYIKYRADDLKLYSYVPFSEFYHRSLNLEYRFLDSGNFYIWSSMTKREESKKSFDEVFAEVDLKFASFKLTTDGDAKTIKKNLKKAADNYKTYEELFTKDKKAAAKTKIEEAKNNNLKNTKTTTSSSSSSSSSGSTTKKKNNNCDLSDPNYAPNPCDCIERTKCPDSSWELICSMEWCEKKITDIPKEECNDTTAAKYGTPAKGATEWSDYNAACMVEIEATK